MTTASQSNWLNGPGLVGWLTDHGLDSPEIQLGYHARAIRRWREGAAADVYVADRILTKLGLHLHEIPENLWLSLKPSGRRYSKAEKAEMARRVAAGEPPRSVARTFGCHHKTVAESASASSRGAGE